MTYGEIRTQFLAILNRSDCTVALADSFLNQGLIRAARDLRIEPAENYTSLTVADPFPGLAVPTDLRQVIIMTVNDVPLKFLPLRPFKELITVAGTPQYFCRVKDFYQFKPMPSVGQVLELFYYGGYTAFSNGVNDTYTSELTTLTPDLIIYAGLSYAADNFLDERAGTYEQRYQQIMQSVQDTQQTEDGEAEIQPAYSLVWSED